MTGTAAAEPAADGADAQAPATVVLPGMRSGPWNSYDRAQLQDAVMVARLAGASQVRLIRPGYATIEVDLKHEKAAGDRESVQAAERSFIERTAPRKKEELTEEQKDARAAARRAKKARQKKNKAEKAAAAAAASEAERAGYPYAQLRENAMFVMEGLEAAAQAARIPTGSKIQVAYSLPPEGGSGFGDMVYATVPMGSVATKVARDWLASELYEPSRRGKILMRPAAACRDRQVADLITSAGASAPADAGLGGRFATGETPRPTTSASEADEGDGGDGGAENMSFDLF